VSPSVRRLNPIQHGMKLTVPTDLRTNCVIGKRDPVIAGE